LNWWSEYFYTLRRSWLIRSCDLRCLFRVSFLFWLMVEVLRHCSAFEAVASTFMTLHIAADAEGLAASLVGTLEGFLASVRVGVDSQT
jgi:hypothetical protein